MSSGLAFGAISRAAPRIDAAEFRIAEQEDREEIERQFEEAGKQTKSKLFSLQTLGTIAGVASLAIPGVNLLGAAMLAGVGAGAGRKEDIRKGIKKSGIDSFKPRFHKEEVRRAKSDIRALAQQQGLSTAVTTALTVYQLGKTAPGLADFIKNIGAKGGLKAVDVAGTQALGQFNKFSKKFDPSAVVEKIARPGDPFSNISASSLLNDPSSVDFLDSFSGLEILQ